jgi:hypothetical protein
MSQNTNFNDFLDQLETDSGSQSFTAVIVSPARPWIRKYAWISSGPAPEKPKESPSSTDYLYIAVRNPSLVYATVDFECKCNVGKVILDKADPDGVYRQRFEAIPTKSGKQIPIDRSSRIQVTAIDAPSELVSVRTLTYNDSYSSTTSPIEESDNIALRF